jgi:hypothetical protein
MCNCKAYCDIFGKIFQILVIAAIVAYVISLVADISVPPMIMLVILIIVYILYIIVEFCSPIFSFLCNKTDANGIQNQYGMLVQTPPVIEFYCECYHFEKSTVRYNPPKKGGARKSGKAKKSVGVKKTGATSNRTAASNKRVGGNRSGGRNTRTTTTTRRVVTHRETVSFPYYSARDVSGLFELKNSREEAMGKTYIKLELTPEINFADNLSYMDYEMFRTDVYNRNRSRDQYMIFRETRKVPGLNNYNFVCIRNEEPCGVNICMYIIFTIIPLAELYKCYINSYCLDQKFTIRKLISTRYDLNLDQQYVAFTPSINVPSQQYVFDPSQFSYINNQYQVHKPTQEEINRAAQYQNFIPNYQCVSYTSLKDGQIKVGVVQDDAAYCSRNVNEAIPPNCQDIGPNMSVDSDDEEDNNMNMNRNMNMNMNMNMAPQGGMNMVPQGNMNMVPQGNMNMVPQGNMNMVPQGNMNMGPHGNMNMGPQGNMNMGPQGNMHMPPPNNFGMNMNNSGLDSRNNLNNNMYNNNMYNNYNSNMNMNSVEDYNNGYRNNAPHY